MAEGRIRQVVHDKILEAQHAALRPVTRRDVHLPAVSGRATAVIGMRRAGKTTFLWQVVADRHAAGTPRPGLLYFNFEDERLGDLQVEDLAVLLEEYYRLNPEWRDSRRAVWLLDEIQLVDGWERFARRLLDTEQIELFLSGSSAKLLSREVATSMRGRAMEAVVYPFSFREYLRHHGKEPQASSDRLTKAERSALAAELRAYLLVGGFPEAQGLPPRDRLELLKNHIDVTLLRDVIERYEVSSPTALRWMTRQLLANPAGAFSVHRFYNELKALHTPIAKDTLHDYLRHLEDAFMLQTIPIATSSERRRMVNPRKVFPNDPGLIPVFDRSGRENLGHALETSVFLALRRRGAEVAYVKTDGGVEVDFLARFPDGDQQLIQVCAYLDTDEIVRRELRGLTDAAAEHRRASRHLVTLTPEIVQEWPKSVTVHSAETWLLQADV